MELSFKYFQAKKLQKIRKRSIRQTMSNVRQKRAFVLFLSALCKHGNLWQSLLDTYNVYDKYT